MADYTLRQLEYFVAVAESGSITGAAAQVHLSQSAMSTALADLERALDVQLLLRHHAREPTLTAAGEQPLIASRRLLAQAGELKSEAHGLGYGLAGALSIGCFEVLAPYVLPDLLDACAERYPQLRLDTHEVDLDALGEGVLSGRFELGLGYELAPDPRLVVDRVFTLPPYVLLPAGHRFAGRAKIRLTELADEPLALLDLPQSRDYFRSMFAEAGLEPNIRYRSSSVETCVPLSATDWPTRCSTCSRPCNFPGRPPCRIPRPGRRRHTAGSRAGHRRRQPPHPPRRGGRRPEHRGAAPPRCPHQYQP